MKYKIILLSAIFVLGLSINANAQFYQMSNGSYMTGYGQVNGSFGYAMATQQMYNTMQINLQKSMARAAMVKKWGEARVRQAELEAAKGRSSGSSAAASTTTVAGPVVAPPPPAPKYYGKFRPDASVNMAKTISETLSEDPSERALLKQVIDTVHGSYKEEVAKKGWSNNMASGVTFFMLMMATVYHDSPEPSDEVVNAVYEAVNQSIDATPDFAKATNKEKQTVNDMLVGFTALPLATYLEGKQNGNQDTVNTARALAGEMIKMVLKTDPAKMKFDDKSLTISK